MSSSGYDDGLGKYVPEGSRRVGTYATVGEGLIFTPEYAEMLTKLMELAKSEVKSTPPGSHIKVGAVCPEIFDEGKRYVLQFSIEIIPVDGKSQSH